MITVNILVHADVDKCWACWNTASDVMHWNRPNDNWVNASAVIDLTEQGKFLFRMETIDGREGFDHAGKYDKIIPKSRIEYTGNDGRKSIITFHTRSTKHPYYGVL